jgi:hypothetical protein
MLEPEANFAFKKITFTIKIQHLIINNQQNLKIPEMKYYFIINISYISQFILLSQKQYSCRIIFYSVFLFNSCSLLQLVDFDLSEEHWQFNP